MKIDIGHFSLVFAWLLSCYGLASGVFGAKVGSRRASISSQNALYAAAILTVVSLGVLAYHFLVHNYQYSYVWRTSNNDMSPLYLVSAVWGGMDGSMLLWVGMLSVYAALATYLGRDLPRRLMSWVIPVFHVANLFFLSVVVFLTNPFRLIPSSAMPTDGNGLNPLLQNPSMVIHPPSLYAGFTGFVVPFAFAFGILLSGEFNLRWTEITRRWTLIAWGFLTAGIILGGNWAYIELGWGGFWAWDPVENASFLPWLSATAYLHSVMVEERRGMLRVWNIVLSVLTYVLTVFGTFLTRSGVVQSVHAFAESDIGSVFLIYIALVSVALVMLIVYRWRELRPENRIESYLSREAVFLFNNLLFLAICFATFWGVMLPVFSEAVSGEKLVVGPPFFNQLNAPLFLALIFMMGAGPLIAWRKMSLRSIWKIFWRPLFSGSLITALFLWIDLERPKTAIAFGLSMFVLHAIMSEFHRAVKMRRELDPAASLVKLVRTKPRQYGGLIVHLGVVVMAVSITASMSYKIERDFVLKVGDRYEVSHYSLQLTELWEQDRPNYQALLATIKVFDRNSGRELATLHPERRFYPRNGESTTEVDIRMTLRDDLYLALAGIDAPAESAEKVDLKNSAAVLKVFINPLQIWLWFGSLVVLLGTLVVLKPRARAATIAVPAATMGEVRAR